MTIKVIAFWGITLVGLCIVFLGGVLVWAEAERRDWVVTKAVEQGACEGMTGTNLQTSAGPRSSRELRTGSRACLDQVRQMLSDALNYTCRAGGGLTVCVHPLNAPDSTTYVRAIIGERHLVLEVIST
ncbi:hypothetical protein [Sphingomonas sp.]|uniref:hypothetical protein n=1 Tax=Sphingomonas sp. TaxID=28214 RepID=UPI002DD66F27|nr:hypothetical protein [Sphingomonas sp.]